MAKNGNSEKLKVWRDVTNIFLFFKWCRIIGIDRLTFVLSCRQLGILSIEILRSLVFIDVS